MNGDAPADRDDDSADRDDDSADRDDSAGRDDSTDRLPAGTRIGRTALRVADLDETTAFYRDVVGLAVLDRDGDGAILGVDGRPLLVLERDEELSARAPTDAGLFHNAFRVPSRAALGEALARVRNRWRLGGASDHLVSEALYLDDPEGNGVEVYRDRPREEWPVADDGTVTMATEPLDLDGVAAAAGPNAGSTDSDGSPADRAPSDRSPADSALVDRAPAGTDVGHVHLEVTSLPAFEAVYVDGLGFDVGMSGPDVRFVAAGGYHHHLGANTWRGRTTPSTGRGLSWFEVVVPDADALEAVRKRLAAVDSNGGVEMDIVEMDGVEIDGDETDAIDRGEGIEVTDADGISVRVRTE